MKLRTSLIVSLKNIISRSLGGKMKTSDIKVLAEDRVTPLLADNEDLALAGKVSKEAIDSLTRQIKAIEGTVEKKIGLSKPYQHLLSMPVDIGKFDIIRQFASYCRLVPGISQSSDKVKRGKGSNQGNHYLKWAFTQAANLAVRYYPTLRKFRDKHANRRKGNAATMVANSILAHKIAIATFHMLKEGVPFDEAKLFG